MRDVKSVYVCGCACGARTELCWAADGVPDHGKPNGSRGCPLARPLTRAAPKGDVKSKM